VQRNIKAFSVRESRIDQGLSWEPMAIVSRLLLCPSLRDSAPGLRKSTLVFLNGMSPSLLGDWPSWELGHLIDWAFFLAYTHAGSHACKGKIH
jgi:hypothetical protein